MEGQDTRINVMSCVKWVEKGKARAEPFKIKMEEMAGVIENIEKEMQGDEEEGGNHEDNVDTQDNGQLSTEPQDEFSDIDDSDKEDELIKESDSLLLSGRFDGDMCVLEVHVYNEEEVSFYIHHEILLPSFPLCFEWLDYEPNSPQGNYCAVGMMDHPIIEIYNLDVMNAIKPSFKLGQKAHRKRGRPQVGHTGSVLSLAWNRTYDHVMASGSADKSIILWDMEKKQPSTTINAFEGDVQWLEWHKLETQSLLAGGTDGLVKLFDCNDPKTHLTWKLDGECETLAWHPHEPFIFMAGTSVGSVQCFDCRKGPLWSLSAHEKEVSGIFASDKCPGLLVTGSHDGMVKVWDYSGTTEKVPELVYVKDFDMGTILSMEGSPNCPFVIAAGGDNRRNNFTVYDVRNIDEVKHRFEHRELKLEPSSAPAME